MLMASMSAGDCVQSCRRSVPLSRALAGPAQSAAEAIAIAMSRGHLHIPNPALFLPALLPVPARMVSK
jgi:hypothetical protein